MERNEQLEENLFKLQKTLVNLGLRDTPRQALQHMLASTEESPSIKFATELDNGVRLVDGKYEDVMVKVDVQLNFNENKGSKYLQSYDLTIPKTDTTEAFAANIKVNYGNTPTLKQAFNMGQNRAVGRSWIYVDRNSQKEEKYFAWGVFDYRDGQEGPAIKRFKRFDLEKTLSQYPIKEMSDAESRQRLLSSLSRGNRQLVTFEISGNKEHYYIQADPKLDGLRIFNTKLEPELLSLKKPIETTPELSLEKKQDEHQQKANGVSAGKKPTQDQQEEIGEEKKSRRRGRRAG